MPDHDPKACRFPGCHHDTPPVPNCGRIDVHDEHPWRTPNMRRGYWHHCNGTPTVTRAERTPA